MRSDAPKRLEYVDGLRGLAILGVLATHWLSQFLSLYKSNFERRLFYQHLEGGQFGVSLFFLVSAFTLYRSSAHRMKEEDRPYRSFFFRRFFRIIPLWILALCLYAWHFHVHDLSKQWCCFLLLCGFRHGSSHLFNEGWSLITEEWFYLCLPILLAIGLNLRRLVFLFVFTFVLRLIWLFSINYFPGLQTTTSGVLFPLTHWYVFALGMLLAEILPLASTSFQRLSRLGMVAAEAAFLVVFAIFGGIGQWGNGDVIQTLFLLVLFFLSAQPNTLFGRVTRMRITRLFGIACYSIYLFHKLLIYAARSYLLPRLEAWGAFQGPTDYVYLSTFPFFAFTSLGMGLTCFYLIERPLIQLSRSFGKISKRASSKNQILHAPSS